MNDKPASSPRQLPLWLVISLMANMMLAGLVAGLLLRPAPQGPQPERRPDRFSWVSKDGKRDTAIAMVFQEAYRASERARFERAVARRALSEAVAKDPYDPEAVREAFRNLRSADDAVNESSHEAMVKVFAELQPEERARMAQFLTRGPGDMRHRRPDDRKLLRRKDGGMPGQPMPGQPMGGPGGEDGPPPPDLEP